MRMPGDRGAHGGVQPVDVELPADADVELSGVEVATARGGGVEEQTLLHRGQR